MVDDKDTPEYEVGAETRMTRKRSLVSPNDEGERDEASTSTTQVLSDCFVCSRREFASSKDPSPRKKYVSLLHYHYSITKKNLSSLFDYFR